MVKANTSDKKVKKSHTKVKTKQITASIGNKDTKNVKSTKQPREKKKQPKEKNAERDRQLTDVDIARLENVLRFEDIENEGLSKSQWLSLSYEDKCLLPLYISRHFRTSSTAAEKKLHNKQKHRLQSMVLKYKKYAMQKFYMKHKREVKKIQEEKEISSTQAICVLWDRWDNEKKNSWFEQYSDVPDKNQEL